MEPAREPPSLRTAPTPELLSELVSTTSALVMRHLDLAKSEAVAQVKREAKMASFLIAGGLLGYAALLALLAAAGLGLARAMPAWAAVLVVGLGVAAIAAILGWLGYKRRVRRPLVRTRETLVEDVRWLKPRAS
jgi:hypothetical protein